MTADSSSESDSDDDDLFGEAMTTDEEDQNDFMTDEEAEVASDREETVLSWPHPKTWERDKKVHPLLEECGDAQWRVPADRTSCKTQDTAPPLKLESSVPETRTRSTYVYSWMHCQSHAFGREWRNDNRNSMAKIRWCVCNLLCVLCSLLVICD